MALCLVTAFLVNMVNTGSREPVGSVCLALPHARIKAAFQPQNQNPQMLLPSHTERYCQNCVPCVPATHPFPVIQNGGLQKAKVKSMFVPAVCLLRSCKELQTSDTVIYHDRCATGGGRSTRISAGSRSLGRSRRELKNFFPLNLLLTS